MNIRPDRDCTVTAGGQTATNSSPISVTILNANWQTGLQLTARAVQDLYDEDFRNEEAHHPCTITYTFTSPDVVYGNTTDRYDVMVVDDDVAGVTVTQTGGTTTLAKGTLTDTYTVVLQTPPDPGDPLPAPPRGPTTVVVTPDAQCNVGNGAGVARTLNFTAATYSTPRPSRSRRPRTRRSNSITSARSRTPSAAATRSTTTSMRRPRSPAAARSRSPPRSRTTSPRTASRTTRRSW